MTTRRSVMPGAERAGGEDELRRRIRAAIDDGEPVTGATVGQWLVLSARTGRRRFATLLDKDPDLAGMLSQDERT